MAPQARIWKEIRPACRRKPAESGPQGALTAIKLRRQTVAFFLILYSMSKVGANISIEKLIERLEADFSIDRSTRIESETWNEMGKSIFESDLKLIGHKSLDWVNEYNRTLNIYKSGFKLKKRELEWNYVYLLLNRHTGYIFYVGRGVGLRLLSHFNDNTESRKTRYIKEIKPENVRPIVVEANLSFGESISLESYLISSLDKLLNENIPRIDFDYVTKLKMDYYRSLCFNANLCPDGHFVDQENHIAK